MHSPQNAYTWWDLFTQFVNAKPQDATVCAIHSVTRDITHCGTKLQMLQSFHFSCNRKMTCKYEFKIFLKYFPTGKIQDSASI
jgi:hypothetical protein